MDKPITCLPDIERQLERLTNLHDSEAAHSLEDRIHVEALRWLAANCTDPQQIAIAKAALRTLDLDFPRWCA